MPRRKMEFRFMASLWVDRGPPVIRDETGMGLHPAKEALYPDILTAK